MTASHTYVLYVENGKQKTCNKQMELDRNSDDNVIPTFSCDNKIELTMAGTPLESPTNKSLNRNESKGDNAKAVEKN